MRNNKIFFAVLIVVFFMIIVTLLILLYVSPYLNQRNIKLYQAENGILESGFIVNTNINESENIEIKYNIDETQYLNTNLSNSTLLSETSPNVDKSSSFRRGSYEEFSPAYNI